ncbi:FYN-binding protein 1 isoform X2 [Triplophysa dalaica]|uniref:FYN-binding protein 1 isoform X2 n=1 Tax=Triplophysa dalaica TaxID=1582913 RepID=UPI0024DFD0AA|nr:FYN-binding protein 1 isoform X2 [Triplophysa dalaica]
MEESVDFKALRAKFHTQLEKGACGGVVPIRPHAIGASRESLTKEALRNKPSAAPPRPILPLHSSSEPKMFGSGPQGVFPRPLPVHRLGGQESPKVPPKEVGGANRVKLTGELLQSKLLKQHSETKLPPPVRPLLPSQKSVTEVVPLRRPLPTVGPRPSKPKRPPTVNLDHLRRKVPAVLPKRHVDLKNLKGPARPPNKPSGLMTSSFSEFIDSEQETYDDISSLPPPPLPPPKPRDSSTDGYPSQADEDSDEEIYEDIDKPEEIPPPVPAERKIPNEAKKQLELDKKELKEMQKRENEYKKRFKLNGPIEVIHLARVRDDWQGGKNDLSMHQGENVEIIRVNNNPEGKWLARDMRGSIGFISNSCVDVDYEEVKRKIRGQVLPPYIPPVGQTFEQEVYDDIDSNDHLNSSFHSDDVYDDVEVENDEFPPPPPEIRQDPKKAKQQEKEEKEFRKKFKFEGPIRVLYTLTVDPNASLKKAGNKELTLVRGEILDVIQETSEKKVLCCNNQGKFGYVPLIYLLYSESDVYDDIDNAADIYDNDDS